jgi:hypothetical protein
MGFKEGAMLMKMKKFAQKKSLTSNRKVHLFYVVFGCERIFGRG